MAYCIVRRSHWRGPSGPALQLRAPDLYRFSSLSYPITHGACAYSQTNWTLRSLVHSWAQEQGVPVPSALLAAAPSPPRLLPADEGTAAAAAATGTSAPAGSVHSHPIVLGQDLGAADAELASTSEGGQQITVPESWTFFQGVAYRLFE